MAQPFLHAGEHGLVITGLEIDHPVRSEPGLRQGRGEQVGPRQAPQHLAARAGGNPTGEQGGSRTVDRTIPAAGHLVQGA